MRQPYLPDRAIRIEIRIVEQDSAERLSRGAPVATFFISLLIETLLLIQVLVKLLDFLDELFIVDDGLFALLMDPHFVLIDLVVVRETRALICSSGHDGLL